MVGFFIFSFYIAVLYMVLQVIYGTDNNTKDKTNISYTPCHSFSEEGQDAQILKENSTKDGLRKLFLQSCILSIISSPTLSVIKCR